MKYRKAAALLFAIAALSGCATTVGQNEVGVYKDDGPLEGVSCCDVVAPNSRKIVGIADSMVTYPTDQRTWIAGIDRPPVEFVSKDGLRMAAPFELRFTLNLDPDTLVRFHNEIGSKRQAWTDEGWGTVLREYLDPVFERAIDSAGLRHDWRALRENEDVRREFAEDARRQFSESLAGALGGQFFCGIEHNVATDPCGEVYFTIGQPTPVNAGVVEAIESEQASVARTQALSAEELRLQAEARARQSQIDQLGPELYVCLEAVRAARDTGNAPPPCYAGLNAEPVVAVGQ